MSAEPLKARVEATAEGTRTTLSNVPEEERKKFIPKEPPGRIRAVPLKIKSITVEAAKATPGALKRGATGGAKAIAAAAAEHAREYQEKGRRQDVVRRVNAEIAQEAHLAGIQKGIATRAYRKGVERGLGPAQKSGGGKSISQQAYEYGLKKGIAKRAAQKGFERGYTGGKAPSAVGSGGFGLDGGGLAGYSIGGGDLGILSMGPEPAPARGRSAPVRVRQEPATIGGGEAEVLSWLRQPMPPASKVVLKKGKPVTVKVTPRRGDTMEDLLGFGGLDEMRIG